MRAFHLAVATAALVALVSCGPSRTTGGEGPPVTANWGGEDACFAEQNYSTAWSSIVRDCRSASERKRIDVVQLENALYHLGHAQVEEGDYNGAVNTLTRIFSLNPNRADARVQLANAYAEIGDYDLALDQVKLVLDRNRTNPQALFARAKIYNKRAAADDWDRAVLDLEDALRYASGGPVDESAIQRLRREEFLGTVRNQLVATATEVGKLAMQNSRDAEGARRAILALSKARSVDPENANVLIQLGEANFLSAGQYLSPAQDPYKCTPGKPATDETRSIRTSYDEALQSASSSFEEALRYAPQSVEANRGLACALRGLSASDNPRREQNLRRAVSLYETAARNDRGELRLELAHAQRDLSVVLGERLNAGSEADQFLEAAISNYDMVQGSGSTQNPQTSLDIADAYLARAGDNFDSQYATKARAAILKAKAADPNYAPANLKLGELDFKHAEALEKAGRTSEASDLYSSAYSSFADIENRNASGQDDLSRAEAFYYRSVMDTENRGNRHKTGSARSAAYVRAVDLAKSAREFGGGTDSKYRNQACLAHIRAGRVYWSYQEAAQEYCARNVRTAHEFLLRGMFHLRQSLETRRREDTRAMLFLAQQAFEDGKNYIEDLSPGEEYKNNRDWIMLEYGYGQFERCNRLDPLADRRQNDLGSANKIAAQAYFERYDVNRCD